MKKLISAGVTFILLVTLAGCSGADNSPKLLSEEGIAPYELSESEKYILRSFGMEGDSQIISFNAPKEAITLNVNVYRLNEEGAWESTDGGAVSLGAEREPADRLAGTFTMQLKENYEIDFVINSGGAASYKTDEILLDSQPTASVKGFLEEFQNIEINREIPVAIMVYHSGAAMRSYSMEDFFELSKFDGMDLVQAVALEFSDK